MSCCWRSWLVDKSHCKVWIFQHNPRRNFSWVLEEVSLVLDDAGCGIQEMMLLIVFPWFHRLLTAAAELHPPKVTTEAGLQRLYWFLLWDQDEELMLPCKISSEPDENTLKQEFGLHLYIQIAFCIDLEMCEWVSASWVLQNHTFCTFTLNRHFTCNKN